MRDYLTAGDFSALSRGGLAEACLACSARFSPMFAAFATRSGPRDYDDKDITAVIVVRRSAE